MKLQAAFLARTAKANVDGTFDVEAGGINEFRPLGGVIIGAPIQIQFSLVVRFELDAQEARRVRRFRFHLFYNGENVGPWQDVPIALRLVEGEQRYYINLILNLRYFVPRAGAGYVEMLFDDHQRVPHIHFRVVS